MQRLSGIDAGFLYGETRGWHMTVGAVLLLDPSTCTEPFSVAAVRDRIGERLARLPAFHHRVETSRLGIRRPRWVDVGDVDLEWHVREATLPEPGGRDALATFAGNTMSEKLDRARPLWRAWYIDRVDDRHAALVMQIHHACIDGVRSADVYGALFDLTPAAPTAARPEGSPEAAPSSIARLGSTLGDIAGAPGRLARATGAVVASTARIAALVRSPVRRGITLPFTAPRTPLNGVVTDRRSVALYSIPRTTIDAVCDVHDVTLNDVVLALCTGGLRRYLLQLGTTPARSLVAQIPVGVKRATASARAGAVPGNQLSAMGALLPVQLPHPVDQLRVIHASTNAAKALRDALGDDLLADLIDAVPQPAIAALARAYTRLRLERVLPPIFNVLVSNVRGPGVPVYLAGAKLSAAYLLGPLVAGSGVNITASSYADRVDIGLIACPSLVPDLEDLAMSLPVSVADLATGNPPA